MRKGRIVCLVGLSVILTAAVPAGITQPAGLGMADQLREAGRWAEAETAYQQLASSNPGTEVGLAAESGLALL